jgi:serine/threonine protein kinase
MKRSIKKEIDILQLLSNTYQGQGDFETGEVSFGTCHPNLMKLYETFETNDHIYLVLERVHGHILSDILKKQKKNALPERVAVKIIE